MAGSEWLENLKSVIWPILATKPNGLLEPVGTAFVIGTYGREALVLSAAHVFDHIRTIDEPYELHHPSTPFRILKAEKNLKTTTMRVICKIDQGFYFGTIQRVWMTDPLDIAVAGVRLDDDVPQVLKFQERLGLHSAPVAQGTQIAAVGYQGLDFKKHNENPDGSYFGALNCQLSWRVGKIVDTDAKFGPKGQIAASFNIDAPIDAGMSGGPIIDLSYSDIVACGIASSDMATDRNSMKQGSGLKATASMIWPAMAIPVDASTEEVEAKLERLLDLERHKFIDDKCRASDHVKFWNDSDGRASIGWFL
jgi:hypothetical protein